ncbi:hypothetical protein GCM10009715_43650 [Paeniglutamicibacter psychrophenolicus]|uniref:helix-turn-helix domain-containing protein n=1 Tax=Paeniglutamicibacter psychrophenolicus TaxID=257454 RepID=UPI001AE70575
MQKLLNVGETAEVLDMHPETVRELLRRGDLVGSKMPGLSGSWKVRPEAIVGFIDRLQHRP